MTIFKHQLIAHRGWQNRYPENTQPAIQAAIDSGCRHIEIDIQLTADLIPVLCHDHILKRISGQDKNINLSRYHELEKVYAYEPGRLGEEFFGTAFTTLEQCLNLIQQHPNITLYVEIKRQSLRHFGHRVVFDAVLPLLKTLPRQCVVISFDIDILCLFSAEASLPVVPVLLNWQQLFSEEITSLNPQLVFCDIDHISDTPLIAAAPYPLAIYEIDDYAQAKDLLNAGAKLIETFAVGELIEQDAFT